jgi:acyl-[acyl-carrier-protein]-phospholipid O-acyltransferase/long-chain-fatty-acid--[acyl-carrier-protein] ligase
MHPAIVSKEGCKQAVKNRRGEDMSDKQHNKTVIRAARAKFIAMAATYCLGVFNDNYFKQAALLLAVTMGMSHLQGTATVLFALPFILCSSYAGWFADRYAKKRVVVAAKGLECLAMIIGAIGVIYTNWPCILAMIFLMGLQSTFFTPALNGSIPELYPETYVARANGVLKMVTTLAILAGIATAGITLDSEIYSKVGLSSGVSLVAVVIVGISFLGFLASFGVYSKPASGADKPFPKYGPISSLKDLMVICRDRQLLLAIFADAYFYFLASIAVLTINVLGLEQFGLSQTLTSMLSISLMLGICVGSLFVARIVDMKKWSRFLVPASLAMGLGLFLVAATVYIPDSIRTPWLISMLVFTGCAGGVFLIPVTSFLQVHPESSDKGQVLATSNFSGFIAILCSGLMFNLLNASMEPATMMTALGVIAVFTSLLLGLIKNSDRRAMLKIGAKLVRILLSLRYKVEVRGLEKIAADDTRGTVFLPNHPALIDPVIVMSTLCTSFAPRPLADASQLANPLVGQLMKIVQPITIPDIAADGRGSHAKVKLALEEVVNCLERNQDVLFYPAGRVYRSMKEDLSGKSGVEYIINQVPRSRCILVRTTGLWGSGFSRANDKAPSYAKQLPKAMAFLLANLLFFGPRRKVTIELIEDTNLVKLGERSAINSYLEDYYNSDPKPNTIIPCYWWQGSKPQVLDEPVIKRIQGDTDNIPSSTVDLVMAKIKEMVGVRVQQKDRLASDLAMDSLMVMELATWLENEFGTPVEDISALQTVEDCLLVASGQFLGSSESEVKAIAKKWFNGSDQPLQLSGGEKITSIIVQQALKDPGKIVIADQLSGTKSYRDILTAVFLLRPILQKIEAERVGVMMPASASATIVYLALLYSGKIPVMYNWTVGVANMAHGIEQTKTSHIITAKALCERIEGQGTDLSSLAVEWLYLEDVAAGVRLPAKIMALAKALLRPGSLLQAEVSETAVILFTSGSEAMPKAVPLSHANIMANLLDVTPMLQFTGRDSLLGMLPPFHSLGLSGTVVLPLCLGLKTVYHANPTESVTLAKIIASYKATTLIGTPTFINGILQAGSREQLDSLKLVLTGAEKCPDRVYQLLTERNPQANLCEGYGITECSPLVSLNTVDNNHPGTIGKVVPSADHAIIELESNSRVQQGQRGMLLLRGPSIFSGYLNDDSGKGFHRFEDKLWYLTGDFVQEDGNGVLSFCGRKKRFIKLGGEMISLPAIETVLLNHFRDNSEQGPPLAIEATATDEHPEIAVFVTFPVVREELNGLLKDAGFSPLYNIRRVVHVDEIPVLGTGKTDYKILKEMLSQEN